MKHRLLFFIGLAFFAISAVAEIQVINGKRYECKDGLCTLVEDDVPTLPMTEGEGALRIKEGYMSADEFIGFLEGKENNPLGNYGMWLTLLLVLLGGLAMNLTPCVLPMIPINLIVIGRSARRGAAYGLGIAVAYGAMGVAAAVGGLAFGEIQGNPWFNAAVALVFLVLSLALFDFFFIDFSRMRKGIPVRNRQPGGGSIIVPVLLGAMSAVLAGACVAPVLISVLLLTADLYAKGNGFAVVLPFVMGVGMALPWPFAGAGMQILPKPGGWMKWVNRVFGIMVLGFAAYYGSLAVRGWSSGSVPELSGQVQLANLETVVAEAKRPLLVDFGASWCKNCAAMERVLKEDKVRKALEAFTVIRVQAEDMSELRKVKGFERVKGLPAFAVYE